MARTFGEELLHFAQSVDIIDVETCDCIRCLLGDYFRDIDFYEVQTDDVPINGRPALHTYMTKNAPWTNQESNSTPIRMQTGEYRDQTTFAYGTGNILWVTEKNGGVLTPDSVCVNKWPGSPSSTPLPPYWEFVANMRTQVVFPLQYGSRVFGILNLETKRFLEYIPSAGDELKLIRSAIAIILWLHDTHLRQNAGTRKALEAVASSLRASRNSSPLVKPKIFVASSSRADDRVIGIIRKVINEHDKEVDEVFWANITASGNINSQMLDALNECSLGVCYFSEPVPQETGRKGFVDNLNVVFEAGILHALVNASVGAPKKWIPVRELQSPAAPFDFASERMIIVNRVASGALNEALFASELHERLAAALKP